MKFIHELVKIKIKKDGKVYLDLNERETFDKSQKVFDSVVSKKFMREPHEDLTKALQAFAGHFGILCGYYKATSDCRKQIVDGSFAKVCQNDGFVVKAVGITGTGEKMKIIITGTKDAEFGPVTTNTPPISVSSEEETYTLNHHLETLWEILKDEVKAYLNGKSSPSLQLEMFTDDDATSEQAVDNVIAMNASKQGRKNLHSAIN